MTISDGQDEANAARAAAYQRGRDDAARAMLLALIERYGAVAYDLRRRIEWCDDEPGFALDLAAAPDRATIERLLGALPASWRREFGGASMRYAFVKGESIGFYAGRRFGRRESWARGARDALGLVATDHPEVARDVKARMLVDACRWCRGRWALPDPVRLLEHGPAELRRPPGVKPYHLRPVFRGFDDRRWEELQADAEARNALAQSLHDAPGLGRVTKPIAWALDEGAMAGFLCGRDLGRTEGDDDGVSDVLELLVDRFGRFDSDLRHRVFSDSPLARRQAVAPVAALSDRAAMERFLRELPALV